MKKGLAIRESKEIRKDCFFFFFGIGRKTGVARERLVAKEWEEREKEKKREFCFFLVDSRVMQKGEGLLFFEDGHTPRGSSSIFSILEADCIKLVIL